MDSIFGKEVIVCQLQAESQEDCDVLSRVSGHPLYTPVMTCIEGNVNMLPSAQ